MERWLWEVEATVAAVNTGRWKDAVRPEVRRVQRAFAGILRGRQQPAPQLSAAVPAPPLLPLPNAQVAHHSRPLHCLPQVVRDALALSAYAAIPAV